MSLSGSGTLAALAEQIIIGEPPFRFEAYDGSAMGPADAPLTVRLTTERGAAYLLGAPGDLGMVRAYVMGDLQLIGIHPGDPYDALLAFARTQTRGINPTLVRQVLATISPRLLTPPPIPQHESAPRWRRFVDGMVHSKSRDAAVISHHYDVSNAFYENVLGPSMAYTCAVWPTPDVSLEEAQENKFRLVFDKLGLQEGQRLLDVGCGWGGMVRYAAERGVYALGVTLSREQAEWGQRAIAEAGLGDLAEIRHCDYRDVREGGFDGVSSIGLTEHIGVKNYPAYFSFLRDKLRPGGLLLNHCITRPHNHPQQTGAFIDRYIFPDGELTGSGTIIAAAQDTGLEVLHEENLREHYALTLAKWCDNLVAHWDECVAEAGEATSRIWGLYLAGSQLGFETNVVQLHQVLATRLAADTGLDALPNQPLRPWWHP